MKRTFYHRTHTAWRVIFAKGFRDFTNARGNSGVWVSLHPVDVNEGSKGQDLLRIDLDISDEDLAHYEVCAAEKPYREWCVPAAVLNTGRITLLSKEDEAALVTEQVESFWLRSDTYGAFEIWKHEAGPENPPLHVSGKWYWRPYLDLDEDVDSEAAPAYWSPCDTMEAAALAARAFESANPIGSIGPRVRKELEFLDLRGVTWLEAP